MKEERNMSHTLCPDYLDRMREVSNWSALARVAPDNVVKFDHTECHLRSVILGKKLYESAEEYAWLHPQYKSLNHMVETLIWRELGGGSEFLEAPRRQPKNRRT